MPVAMALLRDVQNLCPKDVLNFILDLIKYNDNRKNKVKTQIDQIFVCNKVINTWYYVKPLKYTEFLLTSNFVVT